MTVVKKENGYAMVIALIVLTILFLFSTALTVLINGEVSISSNNFNRIKAKYNAEAGIEEGIARYLDNQISIGDPSIDSTQSDSDYWTSDDDYYVYELDDDNSSPSIKSIKSTGYYNGKSKVITIKFDGGSFDQNFIYGNQFTVNIDEDLNDYNEEDVEDFEWSDDKDAYLVENTDLSTYFDDVPSFSQYDSLDLYKEFIRDFYSEYDDNNNGYIDIDGAESYPVGCSGGTAPDYSGEDSIDYTINNKNEVTGPDGPMSFTPGEIYHYRGDLNFDGEQQSELLDENNLVVKKIEDYEYENPPVIVVDGNLEFDTLNAIRNFIFIVKGDIIYKSSNAAHTTMDKSFFYTEHDFNYFLDANNVDKQDDTPHMFLSGQIIAENNVNIKIKQKSSSANNNDAQYVELDWPGLFDYSNPNSLNSGNLEIVEWKE